ncbi:MAG: radical SAM family heme chaperone HemW [Candidatus Omnitrophica bacterium]|nr:radical SAM family heme chaperone HemW [Candidatus Omnitrophota bacterium]
MPESLYIHIPFCKNKCFYCDFYSITYESELAQKYIGVLCQQIENASADFKTIYIGGGTPSVLDLRLWQKLLISLRKVSKNCQEFSLEANPESLDSAKLDLFLEMGVNRISIGLQSLDDRKLKKLGRIHSATEAVKKVEQARARGFRNISIDLIFGVWNESLEGWQKELARAVKLSVDHISLYGLTYEKNTDLFRKLKSHQIKPLNDHIIAEMYSDSVNYLAEQGFLRYEVSNFSKAGYECRHNLNYWDNGPYQAFGPSAVAYHNGCRKQYISDLCSYVDGFESAKQIVATSEELNPEFRAKETAAIKIRTRTGIESDWFKQKTGFDFFALEAKVLAELNTEGLVAYRGGRGKSKTIFLTDKGFLFADRVSSAFL